MFMGAFLVKVPATRTKLPYYTPVKVFLSWSGIKSREVALVLRDWLPLVMNSVEPFVSAKDIYAGTRWQSEISTQLESTNFGNNLRYLR